MKANFSTLFKTDIHKYKFFFIHGNDPLVFDRIIFFLNKKMAAPLQIKSEKDLLADAYLPPSLFEEPGAGPINLVLNVSDKIIALLDQLGDGPFIFTSDKARAQSKLVTYFSSAPQALAIAAYASPLTTSEFEFLVGDLNLAVSFRGQLFKAYQNDYMGLLAALEKIKLYGDVPESAYPSFLDSPLAEDDLKSVIHAVLLKNRKKASEALGGVTASDMIPLLRTLVRAFQTLYELMPFKARPGSIAWHSLALPVFFKDQPIYQAALTHWSSEGVHSYLETLLTLEWQVKYEKLSLSLFSQTLMKGIVQ